MISRCATLFLCLSVWPAAIAPPSAAAGSYEVYACGGPAGGAQNAFAASAHISMSAYHVCPASGYVDTGIVTRATSAGGTAPHDQGAYQIFEAPPGTSLDNVRFQVGALRFAKYWTVGIVAYDDDFNTGHLPFGCYAFGPGCDFGNVAFYGPVTVPLHGHSRFRFETRCGNVTGCDLSYSGAFPGNRALFAAANVVVTVKDDVEPKITPAFGSLWTGGWHRGHEEIWSFYDDNAGVMLTRLRLDGKTLEQQDYRDERWPWTVRCDFTRRRPCNDIRPGGFQFDSSTVGDGEHELAVEAVDAAGNTTVERRSVAIDNNAPAKLTSLVVEGGEGWRRTNGFDIGWQTPAGQAAPIDKAHYRLCLAGTNQCQEGERSGDSIERIENLATPAPGDYDLRVWLEDAAGNVDSARASDAVHLRFDDLAPRGAFQALDVDDPLAVRADVTDPESGVAGAQVEIRRAGSSQWSALPTDRSGSIVSARIDDSQLADDIYLLRLRATDNAGNEAVIDARGDGSRVDLRLPLRTGTRLGVNAEKHARVSRRCKRKRGKRRCRKHVTIEVTARDGRATLSGKLETSAGEPLGGATISALEKPRNRASSLAHRRIETDVRGRFTYRSEAGPSRSVTFDYGGGPRMRPTSERIDLKVAARTTVRASRRSVSNGGSVVFGGRLQGGFLPPGGKLVALQAHFRGRWRTFATPRTAADGGWRYRYRFGATSGTVRYALRAQIPFEAAYPFEPAVSKTVRVTVRG